MKILEVIKDEIVETQEDLAQRLRQDNMAVTQATISRDIKELSLIKVPTGDGRYKYALPDDQYSSSASDRMKRVLSDYVVGFDYSENLILVKTLSGMASGVGEAIDTLRWKEIIGTVAGDNTVMVVVRPKEAVHYVVERLRTLAR
jgi:transcriptional regulator of arginine metabolism